MGRKDTVLISRKPLAPADSERARALFAVSGDAGRSTCPGAGIQNPFHDLLHSPNPEQYSAELHLRHQPGQRQPAVLLLHGAAARSLVVPHQRVAGERRLQDQQGGAAAVRSDGRESRGDRPDPDRAAAGPGHAPAGAERRARIPAVFPVHRRRIHPGRGRADPEVRAVPGTPGACA